MTLLPIFMQCAAAASLLAAVPMASSWMCDAEWRSSAVSGVRTSLSPVRFMTLRLMARCVPLAGAGVTSVLVAGACIGVYMQRYLGIFSHCPGATLVPWYYQGRWAICILMLLVSVVLACLSVVTAGAVGLWAAAGARCADGALRRGYLLLTAVGLLAFLIVDGGPWYLFGGLWRGDISLSEGMLLNAVVALLLVTVCGVCIGGACRRLRAFADAPPQARDRRPAE